MKANGAGTMDPAVAAMQHGTVKDKGNVHPPGVLLTKAEVMAKPKHSPTNKLGTTGPPTMPNPNEMEKATNLVNAMRK